MLVCGENRPAIEYDIDLEVKDARHLTNIAAALRANPAIETVERSKRAG